MLNASQVRTNRAAFSDDVDVEHAGERLRLVADDADAVAAEPREAADDVLREERLHLEELAVVDDRARSPRLHVVRLRSRSSGTSVSSSGASRSTGSVGAAYGGGSRVVLRQEAERGSARPRAHASSSGAVRCATPDFVACVVAPPSSSNVTSSPVTVFTTSGPVMNMYDEPSTMRMKSVIAGE